MATPAEVFDVYEHALRVMREHPHVTAVGVAWGEHDGVPCALACGCTVLDTSGAAITPERLSWAGDGPLAFEPDGPVGEITALAAIRACVVARGELDRALADLA